MLQDAFTKMMMVYPLVKLKVFVDDITAPMEGRIKKLPSTAKKVSKALMMEVEERGFKLPITEGEK